MFSLKKKQKKGCEWVPAQGLVTAESGGRLLLSPKVVMFAMRSEGRGRPAERREGFQTEGRARAKAWGREGGA